MCVRPVRKKGLEYLVTGEVATAPLTVPCIEERTVIPSVAFFTGRCRWGGRFWEPIEQVAPEGPAKAPTGPAREQTRSVSRDEAFPIWHPPERPQNRPSVDSAPRANSTPSSFYRTAGGAAAATFAADLPEETS